MSNEEIIKIERVLGEHENRIEKLESILGQGKEKLTKEIGFDLEKCIENLSTDAGITKEQLRCIFDFEKEDLNLITTVEGKKEAEKQFKATVCILTAYHCCYDRDEISSQDLHKKLEWLGIKSLGNMSANFANHKQFILPKGKAKSPKFSYKITYPGIKKGLEIVKELAIA